MSKAIKLSKNQHKVKKKNEITKLRQKGMFLKFNQRLKQSISLSRKITIYKIA